MFLIQGVASDCIIAKLNLWKCFVLFSRDEDVCVKVVILAKINKCSTPKVPGVWCGYSAAADEGLTREVDAPQPPRLFWTLAAGNQERRNFPAVRAAPGLDHISHNAQKLAPLTPPLALTLSLHQSAHSFLFPFPFLSSPLPAFWRYTHTLSGACSSWPLLLRHFL